MKEPIVLPQNLIPKGISKADIGLMNRDGLLTIIDSEGVENQVSDVSNSVRYDAAQTLTAPQQTQARENLGLGTTDDVEFAAITAESINGVGISGVADIVTGSEGYITTGNYGGIVTGTEGYITTGTGGNITTAGESYGGAGDAGSISTGVGGAIQTGNGGSITTGTTPVHFVTGVTIAQGGTGAITPSAARTNLGATITGDALFTAATAEEARSSLGIARQITVADVSRNNAGSGSTYTNDATLSFAVEANTWYLVEFAFLYSCTAAAGIKLQFTHPALATAAAYSGRLASGASPVDIVANSSTITALTNQVALRTMAAMTGYFRIRIGAAGGNLALQWAQVNSLVDLTTLHAGSLVTVTKI